ncbi:MAG: hypothetical protein JWN78_996 [Bacteroidota bacterium]|nr:hypothetical protein [Bacteroidota bacterium]
MKKVIFSLCIIILTGIFSVHAGDNSKKPSPPVAAPKESKEELRKKDSIAYFNLTNDAGLYSYQADDTNQVLLPDGIKLKFVKIVRLPIPRGANFILPDSSFSRSSYDLAELEMTGTNTTTSDVKLDGSEPVFVSLKFYSAVTNWKAYPSQKVLSLGSYYLLTEPQQTEKMNTVYKESNDFLDRTYKAGQTKTFRGIVVALPRSVRHIDRIVVYTREFGQNKSYGCPAKL